MLVYVIKICFLLQFYYDFFFKYYNIKTLIHDENTIKLKFYVDFDKKLASQNIMEFYIKNKHQKALEMKYLYSFYRLTD